MSSDDLRATRMWIECGSAIAQSHIDPSVLVPSVTAKQPPTRVEIRLAWSEDRQLQFNLHVQLAKPALIEIELDGVTTPISVKSTIDLTTDDCTGMVAGVRGKTFRFNVWHDDKAPAIVRAFGASPFMRFASRYADHLKIRSMSYGWDEKLGMLGKLYGEHAIPYESWFPTMHELGLRCHDEAAGGVEISSLEAKHARQRRAKYERPGLVWREVSGGGRFRGGFVSGHLEILWGWPERKIKGFARGG